MISSPWRRPSTSVPVSSTWPTPTTPPARGSTKGRCWAFLDTVPSTVWVVLDEAYAEYVATPGYPDGVRLVGSLRQPGRHPDVLQDPRPGGAAHRLQRQFAGVRRPDEPGAAALQCQQPGPGRGGSGPRGCRSRRRQPPPATTRGMATLTEGFAALSLDWIASAGNFVTVKIGPEPRCRCSLRRDARRGCHRPSGGQLRPCRTTSG